MTATANAMRLHRVDATARTTWLIVEIVTAEGLVGVGECSDSTLGDHVPAEVAAVFGMLAGAELTTSWADVDRQLWQWVATTAEPDVRFMRGTVVGGIVTAMCDIVSQAEDKPLWAWLGGDARHTVPLYANINRSIGPRDPAHFAGLAARATDEGFSTVKLAPFDGQRSPAHSPVDHGLECVRAVREAVGDDVRVFVDVHYKLSKQELEDVLPELESLDVGWLEDAVDINNTDDLAWLAEATDIPLAGGERIVDPDALSTVLAEERLSFLLLDPKYIGGPLRFQRLLDRAQGIALTYHNPTGPISTAAAAHLSTLHPEFGLLEYAYGEDVNRAGMVEPAECLVKGEIGLSMEPGLGVRLRHDDLPPSSIAWEWTT